jgi:hypothetical protein
MQRDGYETSISWVSSARSAYPGSINTAITEAYLDRLVGEPRGNLSGSQSQAFQCRTLAAAMLTQSCRKISSKYLAASTL